MTHRRWMRVTLGYLALVSVVIGVWAQFAPRSFYDHFPGFGRAWVRVDGPYNEHLVRDVGGLNLALTVVLVAAMVTLTRAMIVTASVAALASGVPHLVYHLFHTDHLGSGDVVASIGGLVLFTMVGVALIVVSRGATNEPSN